MTRLSPARARPGWSSRGYLPHFDGGSIPQAITNRHAFYDVGLAVGNMLVQATALDLFVHQMAGFAPEKVRDIYRIPVEFEPVAVLAVGYGAAAEDLPETFRGGWSRPAIEKEDLRLCVRRPLEPGGVVGGEVIAPDVVSVRGNA